MMRKRQQPAPTAPLMCSGFVDREGVAFVRVARLESATEPLHALLAGAVRPCLRVHILAGGLLDAVVADSGGGGERLFQVPWFEQSSLFRAVAPHSGEAVGLQFLA